MVPIVFCGLSDFTASSARSNPRLEHFLESESVVGERSQFARRFLHHGGARERTPVHQCRGRGRYDDGGTRHGISLWPWRWRPHAWRPCSGAEMFRSHPDSPRPEAADFLDLYQSSSAREILVELTPPVAVNRRHALSAMNTAVFGRIRSFVIARGCDLRRRLWRIREASLPGVLNRQTLEYETP